MMTVRQRIIQDAYRVHSETGRPAESVYVGLNTWTQLCGEMGVSMLGNSMTIDGLKVYRISYQDHEGNEDHFRVA